MAATSGTFNLVEITKVEYADVDTTSATLPTPLKELGADEILDGNFTLDIPEVSVTTEYTEDGEAFRAREAPVQRTASIGLANALMSAIANFLPGTFAAGTAGTTPDSISFDGTGSVANKYIKVTGKNTEGEVVTVELYNARVTHAWTGAMGKNQDTKPLMVKFYALKNKGYGKTYAIKSAF